MGVALELVAELKTRVEVRQLKALKVLDSLRLSVVVFTEILLEVLAEVLTELAVELLAELIAELITELIGTELV